MMGIFIITFIVWAVIHSITAATYFKSMARRLMGERPFQAFYRLFYTAVSVITFLPVLYAYWRLPDMRLWTIPTPLNYLFIMVQLIGFGGVVISVMQTRAMTFVGVQQALDYLAGAPRETAAAGLGEKLFVGGLYRWMRHPLYTFSMLILWATPIMTRNLLIFALAATAYFIIGSIFEEQRLQRDFGTAYADYKRKVPRFIPRPW